MRKPFIPKGELFKSAFSMAWPAILESFFIAFTGLVDSYMVSSLGSDAVAAVGLTTQPKFMAFALFIALNVSVSALVARRKGEGRRDDANTIALTAFGIVFVSAVLLSIILVYFANPIITFCGSDEATHTGAVTYFSIVVGGMIFNCIQMIVNSAQRGAGNTRITMKTNVTSNIVNIIFNYFLIGGHFGFPALGIAGAAIATVFGTVVACIMSIVSIIPRDRFVSLSYIIKEKIKGSVSSAKLLVKMGYGIFFEQLLVRIGFLSTALMAADQGNAAMAAHQVAMNIMGLSFSFGDGLQAAAIALIGQSLGKGEPERAKQYGNTCRFMGSVISVVLAIVYIVGARWLFSLFFVEEEIIRYGVNIMYIIVATCIFQIAQVIYMGCLRGAGDTLYTAVVSTVCVTLIRTTASYLCGYTLGLGIEGIWLGVFADQLGRFVLATIRYKKGNWVKIKV